MRMRHSVKWMLIGVLTMPGLTACSFGGGDEEAPEVEASDEGNAASAEGEGNEAVATEGAEGAEANAANGAEGNAAFEDPNGAGNAATAEAPANEIPPELLNSENPTAGAENAAPADGNMAAAAPEAPAADPAAAAAAPAAEAVAAAAAPAEAVAAPGGSRVYYVNAESVALHKEASASAQSVGKLKRGDPVLVVVEGAWANVVNRGYVEVASLSMAPVGRSTHGPKSWQ